MNNNDVNIYQFPSNASEAIALLYLQNQNLSGKTDIEIQDMYYETLRKLNENWRLKWRNA